MTDVQSFRAPVLKQAFYARCLSSSVNSINSLPALVREFVEDKVKLCSPKDVYVCDGSQKESKELIAKLEQEGVMKRLSKYENCYLTRTDPADVARVEKNTVIATNSERETRPTPKPGVQGLLNQWISISQFEKEIQDRFPNCMKGRTMYVIPFSMGPVGSPLSKIGIQVTDSPYVVASMNIMTRVGRSVLDTLGSSSEFVKCLHSVGQPLPMSRKLINNWPCNPEKVLIGHIPDNNEIISFGSGYGGNSLLGKKCFALRIASCIAKREGWLAEHMLIMGVTSPSGEKRYIAAAFPSACGKTNMAMMQPTLPGWKVECVGDDIAWMRFDKNGQLRAINPEAGFFGVAPGTSAKTNPFAVATIQKNTVFTNVAETADGGVYWEDMGIDPPDNVITWRGTKWDKSSGEKAAHPNARFCTPASQCPIIDPMWEDSAGVPIDAIVFGGRRPEGVPLVYEAFDWQHGVFLGASMRSESTAAAEHKGKVVMHDPFAMRPFFGYNFGKYLEHWLSFQNQPNLKLPKIYHVNWFRRTSTGSFMWPGFGENSRVLEWIFRRLEGEQCAEKSAIGMLPKNDSINLKGLKERIDMKSLFSLPKDFWTQEANLIETYLEEQVSDDLPQQIRDEISKMKSRVSQL